VQIKSQGIGVDNHLPFYNIEKNHSDKCFKLELPEP